MGTQADITAIKAACERIVNTAQDEGRELTAYEAAELDVLLEKAEAIKIEREGKLEQLYAAAEPPSRRKTSPNPISGSSSHETHYFGGERGAATYAAMFGQPAPAAGWGGNGAELLKVIARRVNDPRLVNASMSESEGANGGYLVPPQMVAELLDESLRLEVFRPLARVYPMESSGLVITVPDVSNRSTGSAGLRLQFVGEGDTHTPQAAKFRAMQMRARLAAVYARSSLQLVEDATDFRGQLSSLFSGELARGLDYYFMHGIGAGQPLGVLNAPSLITVSKETSQVANTVYAANVFRMWARLAPWLHRDAVWLCAPSVLPQLYAMSVPVNDASGTQTYGGAPVFVAGNGSMAQAPSGTLLGRPLIVTDVCNQLGTKGDIVLMSPSQYGIGMRREMSIETSNAPGWTTAEIDYRMLLRVDGQPLWDKTITPVKGSDSLSWAVVLETR